MGDDVDDSTDAGACWCWTGDSGPTPELLRLDRGDGSAVVTLVPATALLARVEDVGDSTACVNAAIGAGGADCRIGCATGGGC